MAVIAGEQGRSTEAERLLHRIVEIAPDALGPITDLAHLCNDQQRFIDAIHWFQRAIELFGQAISADPTHWKSVFNLVIVTGFDLSDYPTAFEALGRIEEAQPQFPRLADLRAALERKQAGS